MKASIKWAVIGLAFAATGAFGQAAHSTRTDRGRSYTDSSYWATPADTRSSTGASAAVNGPNVTTPQAAAPGPTMAPWSYGDDIRNANSALWGVGG
jgi:hypothetical protein